MNIEEVEESALIAVFRKPQLGDEGILRAQILYNGEVVAESESSAELSEVSINWPEHRTLHPTNPRG